MNKETLFSNTETANSKQLEILQKHFPQCFDKQGNFIQEKMLEVVKSSEIELSKESYSLNWLGKSYARLLTNLPPKTLLHEDKEHNQLEANKDSQNLLFKGDNLEVLKHMVNAYSEKIKMIYIDPPYNTGSDGFVYNDDRKFTPQQLSELAGIDLDEAKRILDFTVKGSSSHSAWLTFMYPRLYIARELMSDDGVIFLSIDDNELHQLKIVCDEVFGTYNYIGTFVRKASSGSKNDTEVNKIIRTVDYILAYAKPNFGFIPELIQNHEQKYNLSDEKGNYKTRALEMQGGDDILSLRPNMGYSIYKSEDDIEILFDYDLDNPNVYQPQNLDLIQNGFTCYRPRKRGSEFGRWRWGSDKFLTEFNNNNVHFSIEENRVYLKERAKSHIEKYPDSLILDYLNTQGTNEVKNVFSGDKVFSFPKPIDLLRKLINISTVENDIIMDFFAGSGTTAHAVLLDNEVNNKNRRFITIQIDEQTDPKKEAFKAGYRSIFEITKVRLLKASEKIKREQPDHKGDLGFKIFETVEDFRIKDEAELTLENHSFFDDAVLDDKQYNTLLTTWCAYDGSLLTTPIQDVDLNGYTAHLCDKRLYLIAPNFNSETIKALLHELDNNDDFEPNKVVFYGNNFDSAKQMELNEALKGYANKKSLELDLVVRN